LFLALRSYGRQGRRRRRYAAPVRLDVDQAERSASGHPAIVNGNERQRCVEPFRPANTDHQPGFVVPPERKPVHLVHTGMIIGFL
jgi:hypothetical protein